MEVLEQVSIDPKTYHVRISNTDPYGSPPNLIEDVEAVFNPTEIYAPFPVTPITPDGKYIVYWAAPVGIPWEIPAFGEGYNEYKEIIAIKEITVPYGTFNAYEQFQYIIYKDDPSKTQHILAVDWLVPDDPALGLIASLNYNTNRKDSEPHTWLLDKVHHAPAVPIPSAILLFGTGLGSLAIYRRMKLNSKN
jgi:hypothetical protein